MCIRDSAETARGAVKTLHPRPVEIGPLEVRFGQLGPCQACLLYTSDAADERSSVDLGGRRIIKKKTKHASQRLTRQHTPH